MLLINPKRRRRLRLGLSMSRSSLCSLLQLFAPTPGRKTRVNKRGKKKKKNGIRSERVLISSPWPEQQVSSTGSAVRGRGDLIFVLESSPQR